MAILAVVTAGVTVVELTAAIAGVVAGDAAEITTTPPFGTVDGAV
jgi:hypothetical protein